MIGTPNSLNRFFCRLTGGENDMCNHGWFDMDPADLKAELARLKAVFDTAMKTKKAQKFYKDNGHLSNDFFGEYNIALRCGDFSAVSQDDDKLLDDDEWIVFDGNRSYGEAESEQYADDLPLDVIPDDWDANIDDFALRMTEKGIYWIVASSWDDDDEDEEPTRDETPVLPWDFIK